MAAALREEGARQEVQAGPARPPRAQRSRARRQALPPAVRRLREVAWKAPPAQEGRQGRAALLDRLLGADSSPCSSSGTGVVHVKAALSARTTVNAHRRRIAELRRAGRRRPDALARCGRTAVRAGLTAFSRPLGEGRRSALIIEDLAARRLLVRRGGVPPRLPVLLARGRRPADPASRGRLGTSGPGTNIDKAIANNRAVHWHPCAHPGGPLRRLPRQQRGLGALRERFWGTPLNVWVCAVDEGAPALARPSVAEIEALNPRALDYFPRRQEGGKSGP